MIHAEHLMLAGGAASFLFTIYWVRRRQLREKYALFWILVVSLLLFIGVFPAVITTFAESVHLSYAVAFTGFIGTIGFLYGFSVSVSLSRLYRKNISLTQELALLEERLRRLEKEDAD